MEMFDTHRRDILNFDTYMDLKKPGFGGPASAMQLRDSKGKLVNDKPKLSGFQRTVERDPAFSHPVYDPTYKAMTGDLVYKQEGKKAFTYDDRRSGIPVVEIDPIKEGKSYSSFQKFINEAMDDEMEDELEDEDDLQDILDYEEHVMHKTWAEDNDDYDEFEDDELWGEKEKTSELRQIEDKLKSFEKGGTSDEEYESGANPDESPFGPVPDWIKELEANRESDEYEEEEGFEYGANPGECSECGDSDWMN